MASLLSVLEKAEQSQRAHEGATGDSGVFAHLAGFFGGLMHRRTTSVTISELLGELRSGKFNYMYFYQGGVAAEEIPASRVEELLRKSTLPVPSSADFSRTVITRSERKDGITYRIVPRDGDYYVDSASDVRIVGGLRLSYVMPKINKVVPW